MKDAQTLKPIPFVNVVLTAPEDSAIVTGASTDTAGAFLIEHIHEGKYRAHFRVLGYKERQTAIISIDATHHRVNLGTVKLAESAVVMGEQVVTGQAEMFSNSIDRKVYNVAQDAMSKSGSASDVLQNIPSVQVDMDGNVSLRGSSDVTIMINGKSSPLMDLNSATVLQQMPANSIEKIEVITNPSAKFQAQGSAGIINIVLKKDADLGMNGSVTGNGGNRDRFNGNFRLNYNPGNYNAYISYSVRRDNRYRSNTDLRTIYDSASAPPVYYKENLPTHLVPTSNFVAAGIDYHLDTSNTIGVSGNFFYNSFTRTDSSEKTYRDQQGALTSEYDRNRLDDEYQRDFTTTAYFEHDFAEKDHTIKLDFRSSGSPEQENNRYTNVFVYPAAPNTYDNTVIPQISDRNQLSVDYSLPINDSTKIEVGYLGEWHHDDFNFQVTYFDTATGEFVNNVSETNHFLVDQSIQAVYATYEHSFGDFGFLAGLRMERAALHGNLITLDSLFSTEYLNLYPSLHLKYRISPLAELQLNYSRRTSRPQGEDLNPFPEYRDPENVSEGNPHLLPEYTNSVEFGCDFETDKFSFIPGIFYRNTSNRLTSITTALNDTVLLTERENLGTDQAGGVEGVISAHFGDRVDLHANANAFYDQIDAENLGYSTNKSAIAWSGALTMICHLTAASLVQLNSNYNSLRLTPQGEIRPNYVVNLAYRQNFAEEKYTFTATIYDLFRTQNRETILDIPLLHQDVLNVRDQGVIYFGLTYHFGIQTKKPEEEKIEYDEGS